MKNIKSNCEISITSVDNTSQENGDFWFIITDEKYEWDLKSVPGGLIRKHKTTGAISILNSSDYEIKNGKYDRISYALYQTFRPKHLASGTITELDHKKYYRLIILAYKKAKTDTGEKVHEEAWVINFIPEDPTKPQLKKSIPPS